MTQVPLDGAAEGVLSLPAAFGTTFFVRFFIPGILVSLASIPLWPASWTSHLDLSGLGIYLFGAFTLGIILRGVMRLTRHPQGEKRFLGRLHQSFGHQFVSRVENRRLKVVFQTKIEDGMYPPEADYTKQPL